MNRNSRRRLSSRGAPQLLSLVIPCFNEEESLPILKSEVTAFMNGAGFACEVVLVDDGSEDSSLDLLWDWALEDVRIKVISLSRNFGHQQAVTAGLDAAKGEAVVILDADLQDPLAVIPTMVDRFCEGYDVVYGRRIERGGEGIAKRTSAWLFYRLMRRLVHEDLPVDAGDFRLLSRAALDSLLSMRESHRFLRGMSVWVGYPQCAVEYRRQPRVAGRTKYPISKMLQFAWTAAVSFSPRLLRACFAIGLAIAAVGFAMAGYAMLLAILHFVDPGSERVYTPGWATVVTLLCIIGGVNMVFLGVLGEYVGRIFEQTKGRPLYIVHRRVNTE